MFLACEILPSCGAEDAALTSLNQDLTAAFRQEAELWQRAQPDAPVTDAAKIVEMLAERDFRTGGGETDL